MTEPSFDPYAIIKAPLTTEKSIRKIEAENTLVFRVDPQATKPDIKKAVEILFKVKVKQVNVHHLFAKGKRAYVRLAAGSSAADVSADLGMI